MEFSISSTIGVYITSLMMIAFANGFASDLDEILYKSNKYNENRATVHVGLNSIFWRWRKDNKKEIFRIAFIHELIGVSLAVLVTTMFIVTLITKEELIMLFSFLFAVIYMIYCRFLDEIVERKNKVKY